MNKTSKISKLKSFFTRVRHGIRGNKEQDKKLMENYINKNYEKLFKNEGVNKDDIIKSSLIYIHHSDIKLNNDEERLKLVNKIIQNIKNKEINTKKEKELIKNMEIIVDKETLKLKHQKEDEKKNMENLNKRLENLYNGGKKQIKTKKGGKSKKNRTKILTSHSSSP